MLRYVRKIVDKAVLPVALWRGRSRQRPAPASSTYDKNVQKPVLKCSICNGEQVAGFKDIRTGKFDEVALIRTPGELEAFLKSYGINEITKEY